MSEKHIITEAGIQELFGQCTWPELNIALRNLNGLILDRVGTDPARVREEQREYEEQRGQRAKIVERTRHRASA